MLNSDGTLDLLCSRAAYYEINIQSELEQCVSIGLGCAKFPLSGRSLGSDVLSFGVCFQDAIFSHKASEVVIADRFVLGDTIGCGFIYPSEPGSEGSIFFTKNGELLYNMALMHNYFIIEWFPMIQLKDGPWTCQPNFGANPFLYKFPEVKINRVDTERYFQHHVMNNTLVTEPENYADNIYLSSTYFEEKTLKDCIMMVDTCNILAAKYDYDFSDSSSDEE
jgi:hypothetical protein